MSIIRFEHCPPDAIYQVDSAQSFAAAVFDAQEGLVGVSADNGGTARCLVAFQGDLERWECLEGGLNVASPLSLAEIYKHWPQVYNMTQWSGRPVLALVQ